MVPLHYDNTACHIPFLEVEHSANLEVVLGQINSLMQKGPAVNLFMNLVFFSFFLKNKKTYDQWLHLLPLEVPVFH